VQYWTGAAKAIENGTYAAREPSPQAWEDVPVVVPAPSGPPVRGATNGENLGKIARKLRLNPNSPTSKQLLENLNTTCEQFINQFRKGSIKSEFPQEFLSKTVKQALESKNSTVRKLLTDQRFAK
jgi:hypothetical protein